MSGQPSTLQSLPNDWPTAIGERLAGSIVGSYRFLTRMHTNIGSLTGKLFRAYQLGLRPPPTDADFQRLVDAAIDTEVDALDERQLVIEGATDRAGRPLLIILGSAYHHATTSRDSLSRYLATVISDLDRDKEYSILYIHSRFNQAENSPGWHWACTMWEVLPTWAKHNLHAFYVVHSDLTLRLSINVLGPMLTGGLYEKFDVPLRIEFLFDKIDERVLRARLPAFVWQHDAELEEHPLRDYGLVAERPLVPGMEGVGGFGGGAGGGGVPPPPRRDDAPPPPSSS